MPRVEVAAWTLAKLRLVGEEVELYWYGGPGWWTNLGWWRVEEVGFDGTLIVSSEFDGWRRVSPGGGYCLGRGLLI